jgi:DNA-binding FadR family transcriptional regulator
MNRISPSGLRIPGTIARDLGAKIVSGKLKPGTVLDGEIAASDQRQVSRSAYREAVRILVAKGLVRSKPKTGTRVNERSVWHLLDPDVLSWIFQAEPDKDLLLNLFELRKIVEPEAAALAAQRRSSRHLKLMAAALDGMARHTLVKKEGQDADQDFHAALLEASGNLVLGSLTSSINSAVAWSTIFKQRFEPLKRDPVPDHRKVYDAIVAGNPSAARKAMAELVDLAYFDINNAPKWPGDRSTAGNKKRQTSKTKASKKKSPGRRSPR